MCRNLIVSYFPAKPLETPCPSQCDKTSSHQGGEAAARLQLRGAFELDSNPARTAVTLRFFSGKVASSHPCPLRRHESPKEPSEHQATRMRSSVTSSGVSTSVAPFDDMTEGAGGLPARRSVPPLPSSPESSIRDYRSPIFEARNHWRPGQPGTCNLEPLGERGSTEPRPLRRHDRRCRRCSCTPKETFPWAAFELDSNRSRTAVTPRFLRPISHLRFRTPLGQIGNMPYATTDQRRRGRNPENETWNLEPSGERASSDAKRCHHQPRPLRRHGAPKETLAPGGVELQSNCSRTAVTLRFSGKAA